LASTTELRRRSLLGSRSPTCSKGLLRGSMAGRGRGTVDAAANYRLLRLVECERIDCADDRASR
jgi:hypothetical protein